MGSVFPFNLKRVLSLKEARELLPVIKKVTDDSRQKVNQLIPVIEAMGDEPSDKRKALEKEINLLVDQWQAKVEKLGAEPKGLWLVDFDCGVGYFCWKFPENELKYFHAYTEGFKSRVRVDENFDLIHGEPLAPMPQDQVEKIETPAG